jgi:hypothetical protein
MNVPSQFDNIRPYEPEELPMAFDRLLGSKEFQQLITYIMPGVPFDAIAAKMRACKTNNEFQKEFCYNFLVQLIDKASDGCDMDLSAIDINRRYTFMSNHRDIVLDSAFLSKLLIDAKCATTCEIAIGDNLLSVPWIKDLVRINKSFTVIRCVQSSQKLQSTHLLSEYMHYAINEKKENIWIAQREGRAKDSNDRTQIAILKMMAYCGEGKVIERLKDLHIVPLTISYEYDPCDFLKCKELQQRRDTTEFHKGQMDDVISMKTGIAGYKGRIHYHCSECIDDFLDTLDSDKPKNEIFDKVAKHIDREIHSHYRLYPNNYVALDMLHRSSDFADMYTEEDKKKFEKYMSSQLAKIDLDNPDVDFLRTTMLTMYANPAINYMAAHDK